MARTLGTKIAFQQLNDLMKTGGISHRHNFCDAKLCHSSSWPGMTKVCAVSLEPILYRRKIRNTMIFKGHRAGTQNAWEDSSVTVSIVPTNTRITFSLFTDQTSLPESAVCRPECTETCGDLKQAPSIWKILFQLRRILSSCLFS